MAPTITSIRGLQNLTNLQEFQADWNSLTTVNLSGLTNLQFVDISDNLTLDGSSKSLTSVNLSGCIALDTLRLDDSDFSAGIPNLTGLTSLRTLDMDQCDITGSVDLSGFPLLENFDLSGNEELTSVTISSSQPLGDTGEINASNCALTETAVDNILVALSNNGVTGGYIALDGDVNAAPSATGDAAELVLEGNGWSVSTN